MLHDRPASPTNPYPDIWDAITGFEYRSALSLIRPVNTARDRLGEDGDYILQHPLDVAYRLDGEDAWRLLRVPCGLVTDLTSVPLAFRSIVGRVGPWLEAAIVHDYLYVAWQDVPGRGARARDRLFADRVMLRAMEAAAVAAWRRWAIYGFVRLFSAAAYRRPNPRRYADVEAPALCGALVPRPGRAQSGTSSTPEPPQG